MEPLKPSEPDYENGEGDGDEWAHYGRGCDPYKLVERVYDKTKLKYIAKYDHVIASGTKARMDIIKAILDDNASTGYGRWIGIVEYRCKGIAKDYIVIPWHEKLQETKEPE